MSLRISLVIFSFTQILFYKYLIAECSFEDVGTEKDAAE